MQRSVRGEVDRWTLPTVWLHTIMLLLFIVMFVLAEAMDWTHGSTKGAIIGVHKSIGVLIFLLAWIRLLWNLNHTGPRPIGTKVQQKAALGVHHLLYLLMLVIPVSGYFMSLAHGRSVGFFGLFTLPSLMGARPAMKETLENVHAFLAYSLLVIASGHGALALYHHFVLKDETLVRMNPFSAKRS